MKMVKQKPITYCEDANGCHICNSHRLNNSGYPCKGGGTVARMIMKEFYELPRWVDVCHVCDNKKCINISHLFLGTRKQNMQDLVKKGKSGKGEKNSQNKFSKEVILDIKSKKLHYKEYVAKYGISIRHLYQIQKGTRWQNLNP